MQLSIDKTRQTIIACSFGKALLNDAVTALDRLTSDISKETDKLQFIDENYEQLARLKFELATLINMQTGENKRTLLLLRNKLFGSVLRNSIDVINERRKITKLCTEFLKGITFFANEPVYSSNHPMYHRVASCSARGTPNISCSPNNSNVSKKQKSKAIETCYIERLVYDHLWQSCMCCQQDINHVQWLGETLAAYQSCFPGQTIDIDISNYVQDPLDVTLLTTHDDTIPLVLTVNVKKNNETITSYIYRKTYDHSRGIYNSKVTCIKHEAGQMFVKESSFDDPSTWKK